MAQIRMKTPWKYDVYQILAGNRRKWVNAFTTLEQAKWWTLKVKHWDYTIKWD